MLRTSQSERGFSLHKIESCYNNDLSVDPKGDGPKIKTLVIDAEIASEGVPNSSSYVSDALCDASRNRFQRCHSSLPR